MDMTGQQQLRDRTNAIVLDWAAEQQPPFTGDSAEGFAEALLVASLVADEGRLGLGRWVAAARRAGLSWAEIGKALGISKQAAQQRFALDAPGAAEGDGEDLIVRKGATAFNELRILEEEGRKGHELVAAGPMELCFRRTGQTWEYARQFGLRPDPARTRAGWVHVTSWLPFHYFKRVVAAR